MTYGTVNADLITTSDGVSSAGLYGLKNRIFNGAMVIDQRNAGASVTPTNGQYTLDRFQAGLTQTSKYTVQQSSTAPTGFSKSLLVTSSSAYSVLTTDNFYISQPIEGQNLIDLSWGTASAATVTLSFWVRSSLTGTFAGVLLNGAVDRSYPFTYSISSANTWEQKSVTIAGDTTGTWLTTNGVGMRVFFSLGAGATYSGTAGAWSGTLYTSATGATSVVGTNGATFYITGVQLEKGSTATSFDYRPYGTELSLCQRYYYRLTAEAAGARFGNGLNSNTTSGNIITPFVVTMRTRPTALEQSGTAADYSVLTSGATTTTCSAVPTFAQSSSGMGEIGFTVASGLTAGQACIGRFASTTAYLGWSAEL